MIALATWRSFDTTGGPAVIEVDQELLDAFSILSAVRRPVIIVGAGVSLQSTGGSAKTWRQLLSSGIGRAEKSGMDGAGAAELRDMLAVAEGAEDLLLISDQVHDHLVGANEWPSWLWETFHGLRETDPTINDAIFALGSRLATTNYDTLLTVDTTYRPVSWENPEHALKAANGDDEKAVIHLHGLYSDADSVVFGRAGYDRVVADERAQFIQRFLGTRSIVFLGCGTGVEDPNIAGLLEWASSLGPIHFRLGTAEEVNSWEHIDKVRPVVYGQQHDDLAGYLRRLRAAASRAARFGDTPIDRHRRSMRHFAIGGAERPLKAVTLSRDGYTVAACELQGSRINVWSLASDGDVDEALPADGWPRRVGLDPLSITLNDDGSLLSVAGGSGCAVWGVPEKQRVAQLSETLVHSAVFDSTGNFLLTASRPARLFRIGQQERSSGPTPLGDGGTYAVGLAENGRFGVTVGDVGGATLWSLPDLSTIDDAGHASPQPVELWHEFDATWVWWNRRGTRLVTSRRFGGLTVFDTSELTEADSDSLARYMATTQTGARLHSDPGPVTQWCAIERLNPGALAIADDGTRLVVAHDGDQIDVWDIGTFERPTPDRSPINADGLVASLAISGDGSLIAATVTGGHASDAAKQVHLWHL